MPCILSVFYYPVKHWHRSESYYFKYIRTRGDECSASTADNQIEYRGYRNNIERSRDKPKD